jgi:hypothetical protein
MFRETPAWRTSAVVALAQQMRESKDYTNLPILADALEENGFDDVAKLSMMRKRIAKVESEKLVAEVYSDETAASVKAIEFAAYQCDVDDYRMMMEAANDYQESDWNYLIEGGRWEGVYLPDDFWQHYKIVTGVTDPLAREGSFFSCSC